MDDILIKSSSGYTRATADSRLLLSRKIFLEGMITDQCADNFLKQMMILADEAEDLPADIYINSPGGEIDAGLMIYDAVISCPFPLRMICTGIAASMGAVLLAAGPKKKRFILPHSKVMIHQPLIGQVSGNADTIASISESLLEARRMMNGILAERTGHTPEEIDAACTYDHWFNAEEAVAYGLCDRIVPFGRLLKGN